MQSFDPVAGRNRLGPEQLRENGRHRVTEWINND